MDASPDRWTEHMLRGDFSAAWRVSDAALLARQGQACWHWPRHQQYIWNGRPLAGQRVLIRCYHGLGDTVQFIRYAPLVKRVAREVIVWAQPALLPLLRTVPGIDRLLPLHEGDPGVDYDVDVEVMELPHIFRSTLSTLPSDVPYFHVQSAPRPSPKVNVGLVWSAGSWDARRSVPLLSFQPLWRVPAVYLVALQVGTALDDWPHDESTVFSCREVAQTAAILRSLDLLISIDSFPAHLAGALGVPVWTVLHHQADWRWMRGRRDSPWYPTMRLFRQHQADDWSEVMTEIAAALARLAALKEPGSLIATAMNAEHSNQETPPTHTSDRCRKDSLGSSTAH
jgi:hypothetical protein